MIIITDFADYAEIRAILGVDEIELPDEKLGLNIYSAALSRALRAFTDDSGDSLVTLFDAIDPYDMTADEETLYYTIKEYAAYVVAETACSGLSMFALKSESDGKTSQSRFGSDAAFRDVVAGIRNRLRSISASINEAITGQTGSYSPGLTTVEPTVDLVTNV